MLLLLLFISQIVTNKRRAQKVRLRDGGRVSDIVIIVIIKNGLSKIDKQIFCTLPSIHCYC